MLDLSIIIPIYNTPGSALERCFASILELQDITFEVLLIDDGSGRETAEFCKEYAGSHENFMYIRKENGGVSSARNLGLSQARGTYITFVDSDDCLLAGAFIPDQFQSGADLIIFDAAVIQQGQCSTWKGLELPAGKVERADVLRRYINSHALNGPYGKLFKTQLIQNSELRFDESFVTAEDWLFGVSFALQAKEALYVPVSSYLYYRDAGTSLSRLRRFPDTMLENLIAMYHKKLEILEQEFSGAPDMEQLRTVASARAVENMVNCAADLYLFKLQTPERKARILEVCQQAKKYLAPNGSKKARMKAWLATNFWAGIYPLAHMRSAYLKQKK